MSLQSKRAFVRACVLVSSLSLAACMGDGANGQNGLVRFSLVQHFPGTTAFVSPFAAGSTVLLALEEPATAVTDLEPRVQTELVIEASSLDGADDEDLPTILPAGIAQFVLFFPEKGRFRLHALRDGHPLDTVDLTVAVPDELRIDEWEFSTVKQTDEHVCASSQSLANLRSFELAPNDSLTGTVVALEKGSPLVGLLPLSAEVVSGPGSLDTTLPGLGLGANALHVQQSGAFSGDIVVRVTERTHSLDIEQLIPTTDTERSVDCSPAATP